MRILTIRHKNRDACVSFLEHHESILVEASEETIRGDDADLVNITGGVVDKEEEKNNEDAEKTS